MNNLEILRGYHATGIAKLTNAATEIADTIKEFNTKCETLENDLKEFKPI